MCECANGKAARDVFYRRRLVPSPTASRMQVSSCKNAMSRGR